MVLAAISGLFSNECLLYCIGAIGCVRKVNTVIVLATPPGPLEVTNVKTFCYVVFIVFIYN